MDNWNALSNGILKSQSTDLSVCVLVALNCCRDVLNNGNCKERLCQHIDNFRLPYLFNINILYISVQWQLE